MKKDKKKLSDIQKNRLKELDARFGKDNLKKDVGLTDKKGDNLPRETRNDDLNIRGKKGPNT